MSLESFKNRILGNLRIRFKSYFSVDHENIDRALVKAGISASRRIGAEIDDIAKDIVAIYEDEVKNERNNDNSGLE